MLASIQRAGNSMHQQMAAHHFRWNTVCRLPAVNTSRMSMTPQQCLAACSMYKQLAQEATANAAALEGAALPQNPLQREMNRLEGMKAWLRAADAHLSAGSYQQAATCAAKLIPSVSR